MHRRYDAMERLVAWTVRQEGHFLVFRVASFREESLDTGEKVQVPERIECRFSQVEIDPDSAFANKACCAEVPADAKMQDFYTWTGQELDPDAGLQYNRARHYDPTPGRWLADDPLGFEAGNDNLHRYVDAEQDSGTEQIQ